MSLFVSSKLFVGLKRHVLKKKPIYVCIYLIIIFQKQANELSQDQSKYKLFKNQIIFFRSFDLSSSDSHLFGYQINAVPK